MRGQVFIAKQNENPFNNFLSLYLVIQEPERGLLVKIPGKVDLDPVTGQIKTTFDDLPQFPFTNMEMALKGGVRAALVNPSDLRDEDDHGRIHALERTGQSRSSAPAPTT